MEADGKKTSNMTEEDKRIYQELLEEYKDDPEALKIIGANAKYREPKMKELRGIFRDFW